MNEKEPLEGEEPEGPKYVVVTEVDLFGTSVCGIVSVDVERLFEYNYGNLVSSPQLTGSGFDRRPRGRWTGAMS